MMSSEGTDPAASPESAGSSETVWKDRKSPAGLNELCRGTIHDALGIVITEVGTRSITGTMPADGRTTQPFGILHGGSSAVLAESLASLAAIMAAGPGCRPLGLELSVHHLKAVRRGQTVTGTASPMRIGRRVQRWVVELKNEAGDLTCSVTATIMVEGPENA